MSIDGTTEPNVGHAFAVQLGVEWARAEAVDMLIGDLDWLRNGGRLSAVAGHLRTVAVYLEQAEARPLELLEMRLQERHRELEAIVEARTAA